MLIIGYYAFLTLPGEEKKKEGHKVRIYEFKFRIQLWEG
jgi:hypothetical protein